MKPYFRSVSSWFICYPFFIYDCLISAQKIVTHILPSVHNSLQIHTSILQISVPSFSSASKSSEAVAERLKAHPRLDPASEMRYYGFHVFFSCKSNTLWHLRRAIICQSLNYQVISQVNKARIPLASCSKPSWSALIKSWVSKGWLGCCCSSTRGLYQLLHKEWTEGEASWSNVMKATESLFLSRFSSWKSGWCGVGSASPSDLCSDFFHSCYNDGCKALPEQKGFQL